MNALVGSIAAWEAAPYRPNGRHEDAHVASPNGATFPETQESVVAGRILSGEDTLLDALGTLTPGQDVYASYVDNFGGFPTLLTMRNRLNPNGLYFSYTIFGNPAHCADVEPGAMHPASAARWIHDGRGRVLPGNRVPLAYTSAGNADALFSACGENIPHSQLPSSFIYQSAHYGAGPHICGPSTCGFRQAHGTQWDDKGPSGQNFDRALWLPGVLGGSVPPPIPKPPEETMSIAVGSNVNGRLEVFVHLADGSVKHTWQVQPGGHWQGEDPNDASKVANWFPLGAPGK